MTLPVSRSREWEPDDAVDTLALTEPWSKCYIDRALAHANATHTCADVLEMVSAGRAVLWPGPDSIIVTEVVTYPRERHLHFFLAAGNRSEIDTMTPFILEWGRENGCTRATFVGRKGWLRTLAKTGWRASPLLLMEKEL